ncbi:MAG TPA: porphobilinogen synthase [Bdellovibrionales bacterium]|nr:porphobilinogen synthase [Bdellovibrionales bacterium]
MKRTTKVRLPQRPRRNRASSAIRSLVRETELRPNDFILPLFVIDGKKQKIAIKSMPGQFRMSIDHIVETCQKAHDLGIPAVALFPVIPESKKDKYAKESVNPKGLLQETIAAIKAKVPEIAVIGDVAMDPYSDDGHDGLVIEGQIVNDATLEILAAMAVAQAKAGVDIVAPSDMMDGRIGFIRSALDDAGFEHVSILSYAAKYASSFYGPFREALDSAPRSGDKKTYQMDPANRREALREVALDIKEGADIVMVKPALAYLDVISMIRARVSVPVAAYQVSGEYAMIMAAAEKGWIDAPRAMEESLLSIKRAGADMILTYFALEMAERLSKRG